MVSCSVSTCLAVMAPGFATSEGSDPDPGSEIYPRFKVIRAHICLHPPVLTDRTNNSGINWVVKEGFGPLIMPPALL